jgi:S-adenosyl methyltransferase
VEPFDTAKPNIARVWDCWLGGKDNFAADRKLAQKLLEVHPPSAQMAQENRRFLGRAVSYAAAHGIRQFIDVGAGLPTALNTHDIAQQVSPPARVAYVDNDPMVISHARGLLAKSPGGHRRARRPSRPARDSGRSGADGTDRPDPARLRDPVRCPALPGRTT